MIKIMFWLKKPDNKRDSAKYITINNPQKVLEGKLVGFYACEVYVPGTERKQHPIYASNPLDALCCASEFAKVYLQGLIKRGYVISEGRENKEPWKLEKLSDNFLQEKIDKIKNNKDISAEDKNKILRIIVRQE